MEQETMGLLIGGFSIVMGITFMIVLRMLFSKKRKSFRVGYGLVMCHLILFSLAVYQALRAISFDGDHPMAWRRNIFTSWYDRSSLGNQYGVFNPWFN